MSYPSSASSEEVFRDRSIKKQRASKNCVFPDRTDVTMTVPFMDAYVRLLIQTCHK